MLRLRALPTTILVAGLATGAVACKSEDARDAERAAERVRAKTTDVKVEQQDLGEEVREGAKDVLDEAGDVMRKQAELDKAALDFERKKAARINNLEGRFTVLSSMPQLLTAMGAGATWSKAEHQKFEEKLQILRVRIDEAKQAMTKLVGADAASWTSRDDEVERAIKRIDDARDDVIEVVEDASDEAGT